MEGIRIVEKIIERFAKSSIPNDITSFKIITFSDKRMSKSMQANLFKILEKCAEKLKSLEIVTPQLYCPHIVFFDNLQSVCVKVGTIEGIQIEFCNHSNYTSICLNYGISIFKRSDIQHFKLF